MADQDERVRRQHIEALRRACVTGFDVVVHLRDEQSRDREQFPSPWVTGKVTKVATTGAFAVVGGTHVPVEVILRVEQKVKAR